MPDHTHLLVGMNGTISVSDLARDIKAGSSKFINGSNWIKGKFNWQEGYSAFSYSKNQIENVITLLKEFEIEFDNKYLFEWID